MSLTTAAVEPAPETTKGDATIQRPEQQVQIAQRPRNFRKRDHRDVQGQRSEQMVAVGEPG